jgi:nicotinamide-nucleotide amidase
VTGGEILEGAYADAHTLFLTSTLRPLGLNCVGAMTVNDTAPEMAQALAFATNRARLVLITGGLGPTDNDITRQTLSRWSGIPLREHPVLLTNMAHRYHQEAGQLRANLRRQAEVPVPGEYLRAVNGSAAGLIFDLGGTHLVALPGPPRELQPMVREELLPWLQRHFGIRPRAASLTLRFLGLGQSQIDATLKQSVRLPPDLITSSQFEGGRVDFTFSLPGEVAAGQARLEELRRQIRAALEKNLYAEDATTLETVVLTLLRDRPARLALAEMGSGGALAAALSRSDLASAVLTAGWVAPSEPALLRALQVPGAEAQAWPAGEARLRPLADRVARLGGADWVLVTGPAQPLAGGGSELAALLRTGPDRVEIRKFSARGNADVAQAQLVTQLLGWLWENLRSPTAGTSSSVQR